MRPLTADQHYCPSELSLSCQTIRCCCQRAHSRTIQMGMCHAATMANKLNKLLHVQHLWFGLRAAIVQCQLRERAQLTKLLRRSQAAYCYQFHESDYQRRWPKARFKRCTLTPNHRIRIIAASALKQTTACSPCHRTGPASWLSYDGAAPWGRCAAGSTQGPGIGKCCGPHMLPAEAAVGMRARSRGKSGYNGWQHRGTQAA